MRNYGLKFDEVKPQDYRFGGGFVPMDVLQPDGDWESYLFIQADIALSQVSQQKTALETEKNSIVIK